MKRISLIIIISILILGGILRLFNLGYSDYQGDEIKAFFNPAQDGEYIQFLLDQRKGPNQFIVTGLLRDITNNFENYFLTRLPFALAGVLSILVFFQITKMLTNFRTAIFASIFFITNGFLIAFSRIVQYQSFVILFGLLGIYLYLLFRNSQKFKFFYLSLISFAISILFHYDGVFFGIPVFIFFIQDFLKARKEKQKSFFIHSGGAITVFLSILMTFYIPFVLNLSDKTIEYWQGRLTGEVSSKISSSYYLFTVYQPIYVVHFYTIFTIIGLGLIAFPLFSKLLGNKLPKKFPTWNIDKNLYIIFLWVLIPFVFMEALVSIPGTHIYTYLIPLFIIMGFGIEFFFKLFEDLNQKILKNLSLVFVTLLTTFLFLQSFEIFVDHSRGEYPWQEKKFLIFTMNKPTPIFHLSMFGFPYYRNWQEVGRFVNNSDIFYTTNERVTITRYYVNLKKDGDKIGYYILSYNPQTFTEGLTNSRVKEWVKLGNKPVKTILNPSGNHVDIYLIPQEFKMSNSKLDKGEIESGEGN